jgi:flavorubredoxin
LAELLREKGCPRVAVSDLARDDQPEAVEDAFRHGKLVLATTTYNNSIFPWMHHFIEHLLSRNYRNRTIGLIENGTWAPQAAKVMKEMFSKSEGIRFCENTVTIKSALNEASEKALEALADELIKD